MLQSLVFLPRFKIFLHKHSSGCCKPLVSFQGSEKVDSDYFCQVVLFGGFYGVTYFPMSFLCHCAESMTHSSGLVPPLRHSLRPPVSSCCQTRGSVPGLPFP